MAEGYCVKCKAKKEIAQAVEEVMKNGRRAIKGKCPSCGVVMFKILGGKAAPAAAAAATAPPAGAEPAAAVAPAAAAVPAGVEAAVPASAAAATASAGGKPGNAEESASPPAHTR